MISYFKEIFTAIHSKFNSPENSTCNNEPSEHTLLDKNLSHDWNVYILPHVKITL